jgi:Protein of unknown function (DUF1203)
MTDTRQTGTANPRSMGPMSTTRPAAFKIHALPAPVLDGVRGSGLDASGYPVQHMVAKGGEPLRCCLRNALPGEKLMLFGFAPPIPASPYREIGAVFAHADACQGYPDAHAYPQDWYGRAQVLRAYDAKGWIHDATRVHDSQDSEAVIANMLAVPDVVQIHSRNVAWGCYMFAVTRAD